MRAAHCEFESTLVQRRTRQRQRSRDRETEMSTSNSKLILDTVKTVVLDDGFMPIASVSAKRARDVCVSLNEWMKIPESAIPLNDFAEQFVSLLN